MKRTALFLLPLLVACLMAHQAAAQSVTNVATIKSLLSWDLNPASDAVDFYNVYVTGPTNQVVLAARPPVSITNIVANAANGVYTLNVTAVNLSGIESDPSTNVYFFWYGQKPMRPTGQQFSFTKAAK